MADSDKQTRALAAEAKPAGQRLTPLQRDLLPAFFAEDEPEGFFLSGGAALVGWFLEHRHTDALDLFCTDDSTFALADGRLRRAAQHVGATIRGLQRAPEFLRHAVERGDETVVVDLVRDRAPQLFEKERHGRILLDPLDEIVVNKICAVLGRSEVRDIVDLRALAPRGYRLVDWVDVAARKDGGVTAGQLAWVLEQVHIDEGASLPGDVAVAELREFIKRLTWELRDEAFPTP